MGRLKPEELVRIEAFCQTTFGKSFERSDLLSSDPEVAAEMAWRTARYAADQYREFLDDLYGIGPKVAN